MHDPRDRDTDPDVMTEEEFQREEEAKVEREWKRFWNESPAHVIKVADNTIIICALMVLQRMLGESGYSPKIRRRMNERIEHLIKRYQGANNFPGGF